MKKKKPHSCEPWCLEADWSAALPRRLVSDETFVVVVQTDWIAPALNHSEAPQAFHVSHDQTNRSLPPSRSPVCSFTHRCGSE